MKGKGLSREEYKKLEKRLARKRRHVWSQLTDEGRKDALKYADDYKKFLDRAKTEREASEAIMEASDGYGFVPFDRAGEDAHRLMWGFKGKMCALVVVGRRPITEGALIIASHIDAPRLDLKQNPLYEDLDMAYLKTHYYGGIKKFQWLTRPLALHGVAIKEDGRAVSINIGEDPLDPVFTINDILPHLAYKVQADKKISEAVTGEKLNVIFGGIPLAGPDDMKESVKLSILNLLNERYGLVEEDLVSAELEFVPAGPARDVGLDRAFVGAYGHDDRACAYASFMAIAQQKRPDNTLIALFLDKEEIGSDGNTGAKSRLLEAVMYGLVRRSKVSLETDTLLGAFMRSKAISGDVTAGVDPDYLEVHEKRNDALMGYGICLTKYTGSRGKVGANDAHAEYMGWIRGVWNSAGVIWQAGELGKVDEGGGGTVAKYLAEQGMDVVDAGTPLLSMHSPFEVAHKADLYMTYRAYRAFYGEGKK
ncbi:MAG: aminopeptidase [Desulfobacteraceae bacterium]|nr:aminopeptidase [Desulfobacteraceae bacterium]